MPPIILKPPAPTPITKVTLPETFFGWLNVTRRVGGRFTYYGDAAGPGATTDEVERRVFNTGAEVTFKLSQLWPGVHDQLLDLDGLRHIIEPSINYVYMPTPNAQPPQLPQFDYELPSLRLLPIEFPEYNSIDSIDSENVMRFGLRNTLQTKRDGRVEDLLDWQLYTDWRLRPNTNQETFADLYSDLSLLPRSGIKLESQTRLDLNTGSWNMLLHAPSHSSPTMSGAGPSAIFICAMISALRPPRSGKATTSLPARSSFG